MESHLNAAKLKNLKETSLKGKLKKNLSPTEKQSQEEISAINVNESKETVPNSSEETGNTEIQEIFECVETGQFSNTMKPKQKDSINLENECGKPKTKSQLSLKSKAYTRPGTM